MDLAVAADAFVYLGDLDAGDRGRRRRFGALGLLVFTVESGQAPFALAPTMRFRHSDAHVREAAEAAGLEIAPFRRRLDSPRGGGGGGGAGGDAGENLTPPLHAPHAGPAHPRGAAHAHLLAPPGAQDRRVQFAAEDEDRRHHVEKHQCDHHRGEPGVGRDVIARELAEIEPERLAEADAADEGEDHPRRDVDEAQLHRRQPQMRDQQRHAQDHGGDPEPDDRHQLLQRRELRGEIEHLRPDQRPQHHEEGERQQPERGHHHEQDRLQPQQPPRPVVERVIGAVEPGAQSLDAARREIQRQHRADGQQAAARLGQHVLHLAGDRPRHLLRPRLEDEPRRLTDEVGRAQEARQRRDEDEEREHRGQHRQRDMAGDGPAVIDEKTADRVEHHARRRLHTLTFPRRGETFPH